VATSVNAYRTGNSETSVDGIVTVVSDAIIFNPSTAVFSNLNKVYSDLGLNQNLWAITYLIYQKDTRPNATQFAYSFAIRLGARSGNLLNPFLGPTGPIGPVGTRGTPGTAGDTGPAGPVGPQGQSGNTGPTGPMGATGAGSIMFIYISIEPGEIIPVGSLVKINPSGRIILADYGDPYRFPAHGFVQEVSGTIAKIAKDGPATFYSSLDIGEVYYLGSNGQTTVTPPYNKVGSQTIGIATSSSSIFMCINQSIVYGV
jgi:hypothetical protein